MRSYLPQGHPDKAQEIGLSECLDDYIATLVDVFREVRRVLRPDGTLWLNIGDSYYGAGGANNNSGLSGRSIAEGATTDERDGPRAYSARHAGHPGLKPKDLCLVPARLALALQAAGWWVRSEIVWCKASCMPEPVTDRPTSAHERIYLLAASEHYYYDHLAVRQPHAESTLRAFADGRSRGSAYGAAAQQDTSGKVASGGLGTSAERHGQTRVIDPRGANLRNYWLLGPEPSAQQHYATFPTEIPRRAILAGTSDHGVCPSCGGPWIRIVERTPMQVRRTDWGEQAGNRRASSGTMLKPPIAMTTGWRPSCTCCLECDTAGIPTCGTSDQGAQSRAHEAPAHRIIPYSPIPATVLDCFLGSGTTALVAKQLGRRCVGVDLSATYLDIAVKRCSQLALFVPTEVPA